MCLTPTFCFTLVTCVGLSVCGDVTLLFGQRKKYRVRHLVNLCLSWTLQLSLGIIDNVTIILSIVKMQSKHMCICHAVVGVKELTDVFELIFD